MNKILAAALVVGVIALSVTLTADDPAREKQLQQAIDLLESKGDVAKATPLLESVAKSADRALAARALLYLGQAQERQDQARARNTYERIVREFSAEATVAAEAHVRLSAMGSVSSSAVAEPRLVCEQCGGVGYVSSDGRSYVVSNISSGSDIALRDVSTGSVTRLRAKTDTVSPRQGGEQAYWPLLSGDSRQIAYAFVPSLIPSSGTRISSQLRVMPNQPGARARVLVDNPEISYTVPVGWLENSSVLTLMQKPDRTWRLAWVATATGAITPLKSLDWRVGEMARAVSLSPDGRYIAYAALAVNPSAADARPEPTDRRIYVLASDGSSEVALTGGTGVSNYPIWTPDGSHVLYTSDVSGTVDLWAIPVTGGKPAGQAKLLRKNIGDVVSLGMTTSGTYHYFESRTGVHRSSVRRISNNGATGSVVDSFIGMRPAWSPDGRSIAVSRPRPHTAGEFDVVVRSLETGAERVYRRDGLNASMTNLWLPDGKSLLKLVREGDVDAWYRLDLESGEFRKLAAHGKNSDEYFFASSINALSPDGRRLYFGASKPTNPGFIGRLDRIGSLDLVSGERQILFMLPGTDDTLPFFTQGLEIAISPNGQTFAVTHYGKIPNSTHLARVDITGQNYRELTVPFKNDQLGNKLTWSRDGRSIFFVMRTDGDKDRVMRVSADGGQPEFTGVEVDGLNDFDLSPDGERIASGTVRPEGTGMLHWTLDVASLLRLRR